MKILVFDIDGTLTQTNAVDGACYRNAVEAALPHANVDSFERFEECTDSGILAEICAEIGESEPDAIEARVRESFFAQLADAATSDPTAFAPTPGARGVFAVARQAGWVPAIATGGWRPSAELKLATADIPIHDVPLVTSSEAPRRVDIIRRAVEHAARGSAPSRIVYVGDGTWDVRACRELGIGFLGRAARDDAGRLERLGARVVIDDFSDSGAFARLLSDPASLALANASSD